jgi:hypothetical protein
MNENDHRTTPHRAGAPTRSLPRVAAHLVAAAAGLCAALGASAQGEAAPAPSRSGLDGWELTLSPYTYHFHPSDEHEYVYQIGVIKKLEDRWIAGASYFSNSFGQPSAYVYIGQRYEDLPGFEKLYLQWNVGILYGYVGEFKDKVPFNYKGFSPGFVPSIGYKFSDRVYGELDLLGNSALMFNLVFPLPP